MENLKLTSIRLDPDVLRDIDHLAEKHSYFKRSSIINAILRAIVKCSSPGTLWKIISTYSPETCGYTVDFHVDRDKLARVHETE